MHLAALGSRRHIAPDAFDERPDLPVGSERRVEWLRRRVVHHKDGRDAPLTGLGAEQHDHAADRPHEAALVFEQGLEEDAQVGHRVRGRGPSSG